MTYIPGGGGGGGTTTNALTINNGGAGAASGATFNGSAAVTISYNTLGAQVSGSYAASSHSHTQSDLTGLTTADSPQFTALNLGHASDTTLTRVSAGVVAVEGVNVVTTAGGVTFSNDISVPAEVYGSGWNGSNEAPTKNDVYDKIETLSSAWRLAGGAYTAAGVWDQALDGSTATVNFTGLAGYSEAMIIARDVTKSGSADIWVLASVNNGSSYFNASGDYQFISTAGVITANTIFGELHATSASAARSGVFVARNLAAGIPVGFNQTSGVNHRLFVGSSSAINALRVYTGSAATFNGGKIYCLVR